MSRRTRERKSSHRSSGHSPYDLSLGRRGSLPPDYQDAVHMDAQHAPQATNKRKRSHEDSGYENGEYLMMEVTRREQEEILRRREQDHNYSPQHYRRRSRDHHNEERCNCSCTRRDDTTRTTSGVNILSNAQGGVIRGGRYSVVGRDQTIVHTEVDPGETPIRSRNPSQEDIRKPGGERDSSGNQARTPSPWSESPTNTVSILPFVRNFEIIDGEFNAVKGNQSITTYTHSARTTSPFEQDTSRVSKAGSLSSSSSRLAREQYSAITQDRQRAASRRPSNPGSVVSGPSVLAFASEISLLHSKAQAGSFSAVGGNQTINVG